MNNSKKIDRRVAPLTTASKTSPTSVSTGEDQTRLPFISPKALALALGLGISSAAGCGLVIVDPDPNASSQSTSGSTGGTMNNSTTNGSGGAGGVTTNGSGGEMQGTGGNGGAGGNETCIPDPDFDQTLYPDPVKISLNEILLPAYILPNPDALVLKIKLENTSPIEVPVDSLSPIVIGWQAGGSSLSFTCRLTNENNSGNYTSSTLFKGDNNKANGTFNDFGKNNNLPLVLKPSEQREVDMWCDYSGFFSFGDTATAKISGPATLSYTLNCEPKTAGSTNSNGEFGPTYASP